MKHIISITRLGQLTIPSKIRKDLGIYDQMQAEVEVVNDALIIRPKTDFWSLPGSLSSNIHLTDEELRKARDTFESSWANT
jgi:AbrB family looped-hinge helix DNA binding protein